MPALAAIVNPGVPKDTSINLFYNNSSAQLAFTIQSGTEDPDPESEAWASSQDDYPGYILNPSEIAGGVFLGVNFVAAVTTPKIGEGATQTVNQISIVSPVYQKIATTSLANKTIAFASSNKEAWVYFLGGAANGRVYLQEYNLLNHNEVSYLESQDVTLNSSLGAWFNPENNSRYVIYQELNQNHLKEYNVTTNEAFDIESTDDAKPGTSVAVTHSKGITSLYYIDNSNNVRRVVRDTNNWGPSFPVKNSDKVGTSQLTVVTANGYNHLFYLSQDNVPGTFTHNRDLVPKGIEG